MAQRGTHAFIHSSSDMEPCPVFDCDVQDMMMTAAKTTSAIAYESFMDLLLAVAFL